MRNLTTNSKILGFFAIIFSIGLLLIGIPTGIYVPESTPLVESPSFFPTLLSVALGVLGLCILILKENVLEEGLNNKFKTRELVTIVLLFVVYYSLINLIGILLASVFVLYGFMKMFGVKGQIKPSLVATLIPILLVVFFEAFDVNFPLGIVTEWVFEYFGWA